MIPTINRICVAGIDHVLRVDDGLNSTSVETKKLGIRHGNQACYLPGLAGAGNFAALDNYENIVKIAIALGLEP